MMQGFVRGCTYVRLLRVFASGGSLQPWWWCNNITVRIGECQRSQEDSNIITIIMHGALQRPLIKTPGSTTSKSIPIRFYIVFQEYSEFLHTYIFDHLLMTMLSLHDTQYNTIKLTPISMRTRYYHYYRIFHYSTRSIQDTTITTTSW